MSRNRGEYVVLGAGVVGLTTALELRRQDPSSTITVVAKHRPGVTSALEYASPWAGANWISFERLYNEDAEYDRVSFLRFVRIAAESPESGVRPFELRQCYDSCEATKSERWYEQLVGGMTEVHEDQLPPGAKAGIDMKTFMINPGVYLAWLQTQLLRSNVKFFSRFCTHIDEIMEAFPSARAIFNCTGLGAHNLGGVNDSAVYPIKGQTLLVAEPNQPLNRMYIQIRSEWENEFAHVFPRPLGGGVIIGGVRRENDWSTEVDMALAERIKERCCKLAPELGSPETLQVISHNVGLRPARKGGVHIELERRRGYLLIHNYGASGAGYQASWGMAEKAVKLLLDENSLKARV